MDVEKKDSINNTKSFAKGSIFSTQDLTVNTENLPPQITDAEKPAWRDNQARISSAFGHTDAAHGMGSVVSSRSGRFQGGVTEDITLPRATRKHSKLLCLLIGVVLVLAVGGGALFLLRGVGGDGATPVASLEEAQRAFARYANYLLYGEERDELTGEFEVGKTYELDRQLSDKNPDSEYWKKASELLNTAVTGYEGLEEKQENVVAWLNTEKMNFDFLNAYRQVEEPTADEILARYLAGGENGVKKLVEERYKTISSIEGGTPILYMEAAEQYYQSYSDTLNLYRAHGCLDSNTIDESCATSMTEADLEAANTTETTRYYAHLNMNSLEGRTLTSVESSCFEYKNIISTNEEIMDSAREEDYEK